MKKQNTIVMNLLTNIYYFCFNRKPSPMKNTTINPIAEISSEGRDDAENYGVINLYPTEEEEQDISKRKQTFDAKHSDFEKLLPNCKHLLGEASEEAIQELHEIIEKKENGFASRHRRKILNQLSKQNTHFLENPVPAPQPLIVSPAQSHSHVGSKPITSALLARRRAASEDLVKTISEPPAQQRRHTDPGPETPQLSI